MELQVFSGKNNNVVSVVRTCETPPTVSATNGDAAAAVAFSAAIPSDCSEEGKSVEASALGTSLSSLGSDLKVACCTGDLCNSAPSFQVTAMFVFLLVSFLKLMI